MIPNSLGFLGKFNQNECVNIVTVSNFTQVNISIITSPSPNSQILIQNKEMTRVGNSFNYTFCNTTKMGEYTYGYCEVNGDCYSNTFLIQNSNIIYLLFIYIGALFFLICTIFVDEELFVYLSGILFLLGGVYTMINGIDILYNTDSRYISYISIGIGMLFTLGAYIFNHYYDNPNEEEEL